MRFVEASTDRRSPVSRRRFVGLLGLGAVGLAGCLDGGDGGGAGDSSGAGTGDADGEDSGNPGDGASAEALELFDHPGDEAADIPDEYNCPVCNMRPNQFPNWTAQLAHDGGEGTAFDTAGCLFAYVVDPEGFGGPGADIVGAWVTDFETRETIDAEEASFVLEHDTERVDDPMELNPAPFAELDDALAYVDEFGDLSEADVIGLEEVSREEAELYRGKRLP